MDTSSIEIRFGEFDDVAGPARRHEEVTIVPATVRLMGYSMTNGSYLDEFTTSQGVSAEIKALIHPGEDAPWACGRIQRVFSLPQVPEEDRAEKSCMGFSFLAVLQEEGKLIGVPFECTDYYGRSVLLFSSAAPPREVMHRVAKGFWSNLLDKPHDLPDYNDRFSQLGGGFEVAFGVRDGEPFLEKLTA
jgi:hypothetical protein